VTYKDANLLRIFVFVGAAILAVSGLGSGWASIILRRTTMATVGTRMKMSEGSRHCSQIPWTLTFTLTFSLHHQPPSERRSNTLSPASLKFHNFNLICTPPKRPSRFTMPKALVPID
jgi:hypothetical protein